MDAVTLVDQLSPEERALLRNAATELRFSAGQEIFKEGDPGNGAYAVRSGKVQISCMLATGERSVLATVPPGDVFGEMAVIDDKPRSATAIAEVETEVYFVPRETAHDLIERVPRLATTLLKEISGRLREFNHHHIERVVQSERLAVIGKLASSIIHDLRTPLTVIGLTTELACGSDSNDAMRLSAKNQILKQVGNITQMVGDVLEFARGSATPAPLSPVNYRSFVAGVLDELDKEVEHRGVTLSLINEPPDLELQINAPRLSRVFWNLVRNAADVLPRGGHVKLGFSVTDKKVITEVEDNGKGIAPEILDRLFEAFATFGKPQGTGLGLSITRKIIEEHGGRISARNQPGGGAVFTFTLPR